MSGRERRRAISILASTRVVSSFKANCQLAKDVANGVLRHAETAVAFSAAANANGALTKYGQRWIEETISRAIHLGRNDLLPSLEWQYRQAAETQAEKRS